MKLKSISAWRQINWNIGTDLDGLPESMQEVTDSQAQRQISQEFQLTGKAFSDRLDYVAGLYYFQEGGYVHDYVPFDTGYLYVYDISNDVNTTSYAGYFHVDYKITDDWGVTAGGRYSDERKKFLGGQADLNGFSYKISGCLDPNASANTFPASPGSRPASPANKCWDSRCLASRCATSRMCRTARPGMYSIPLSVRSTTSRRT